MTRSTRRTTAALAAAVLIIVLAACGASGGGESADTTVKKTTTTAKETTTTEEETTTTEAGGSDLQVAEEYTDDFEDDTDADGWDVGSDEKGSVGIEEGAYYTDVAPGKQFYLASDGFRDWETDSVGASAVVQKFGQSNPWAGIVCLGQAASDGTLQAWYELGVSAEGRASIFKFKTGDDPVELLSPTAIDGFDRDTPFKLDLACITSDDGSLGLAIQVDGQDAGSAVDDDPLGAGVVKVTTLGDENDLSTVYFNEWNFVRYE